VRRGLGICTLDWHTLRDDGGREGYTDCRVYRHDHSCQQESILWDVSQLAHLFSVFFLEQVAGLASQLREAAHLKARVSELEAQAEQAAAAKGQEVGVLREAVAGLKPEVEGAKQEVCSSSNHLKHQLKCRLISLECSMGFLCGRRARSCVVVGLIVVW